MSGREPTDGSGTKWCLGYPRVRVHQVAVANVTAKEYVPGVTEHAGYSTNASRKPVC